MIQMTVNKSRAPRISVIMPVYNSEKYLEGSIKSILNQTYRNFEFIIICDDPNEQTKSILDKYVQLDPRIHAVYQDRKGLIVSRNQGCKMAQGDYIAVMDSDDISLPERFERQIATMQMHPEIGILGSNAFDIDNHGNIIGTTRLPMNPILIGWHLFFGNCLYHATTMIRRDVLEELNFYQEMPNGFPEDYDLWTRAFFITKIANLHDALVLHRVHGKSNSVNVNREIIHYCNVIRNVMHETYMGPDFLELLTSTGGNKESDIFRFDTDAIPYLVRYIESLFKAYSEQYTPSSFELRQIRIQISRILMTYTIYLFRDSKRLNFRLFTKSVQYSIITALKESRFFVIRNHLHS